MGCTVYILPGVTLGELHFWGLHNTIVHCGCILLLASCSETCQVIRPFVYKSRGIFLFMIACCQHPEYCPVVAFLQRSMGISIKT